jgi:hypothetical protein
VIADANILLDQINQLSSLQRFREQMTRSRAQFRGEITEACRDFKATLPEPFATHMRFNKAPERLGSASMRGIMANPLGIYDGDESTTSLSLLADELSKATIADVAHQAEPSILPQLHHNILERHLRPQQEQLVNFISTIISEDPDARGSMLYGIEAGPGCGKSYALETAVHQLFRPGEVIILARHGIVANWYGDPAAATIQTGLCIPVNTHSAARYENLPDDRYACHEHTTLPASSSRFIEAFRETYSNLRIVLIDEMQMVDSSMLYHIILRIREILGRDIPICFALDNNQLGPINRAPMYRELEDRNITRLLERHEEQPEGEITSQTKNPSLTIEAERRFRTISRTAVDRTGQPLRVEHDVNCGLDAFATTEWMRMTEYIRSEHDSSHTRFLQDLHNSPTIRLSLERLEQHFQTLRTNDFASVSIRIT